MNIAKDLFFAQQIIATLFSTTNKLQMEGDKHLQDITIRQMLAIPALIHAPEGKATINSVARQMETSKQSAKQIVEALTKKNYLSVAPSELDKRAVDVKITAEGEKAFMVCSERADEFSANIFRDFTTEELEIFCELLQKLHGFDGAEQESLAAHINYNTANSDEILKHHSKFVKLRTTYQEKEH